MSTIGKELLKSFDLLPQQERYQIASEIMRRAFAPATDLDDAQLAVVYAEFAETDRVLAEAGIDDYDRGLLYEDAE